MKPFYLVMLSALLLFSCDDNAKKTDAYLPQSSGRINTLQIVTPNELWNGSVGEEIRTFFAAPTDGLPQDEPLFTMNQMPPEAHTGFARNNRLFLYLAIGKKDRISFVKNKYAKPQTGVIVTATSKQGLVKLIKDNHQKIIDTFHDSEIAARQKQTRVSLLKIDSLQERMGVSMEIPSAYHVAKSSDHFYWIRKDLKSGSTNIIIYQVPLNMIGQDSSVVGDIIHIRDSIGGNLLPVEDDGRFHTEEAYAPYLFKSQIDGKFAYETKGTWDVKDEFMSGPFLNYAVYDKKNNRYLILEGFTFAPSVAKRDLQLELESILKSAKID